MRQHKVQSGFTLVELLLALSILVIVILAAVVFMQEGVRMQVRQQTIQEVREALAASKYAIERDGRHSDTVSVDMGTLTFTKNGVETHYTLENGILLRNGTPLHAQRVETLSFAPAVVSDSTETDVIKYLISVGYRSESVVYEYSHIATTSGAITLRAYERN